MKKIIFILSICLFTSQAFSQKTITIKGDTKFSCSEKYGLNQIKNDYILSVVYTTHQIKFNTAKKQRMVSYDTVKSTDKFIIGKNADGNYLFYNIKSKQLFYIDYYKRYITAGYGKDNATLKQTVLKMMEMLKNGKSQKDVIQHLIEQTKYDF